MRPFALKFTRFCRQNSSKFTRILSGSLGPSWCLQADIAKNLSASDPFLYCRIRQYTQCLKKHCVGLANEDTSCVRRHSTVRYGLQKWRRRYPGGGATGWILANGPESQTGFYSQPSNAIRTATATVSAHPHFLIEACNSYRNVGRILSTNFSTNPALLYLLKASITL